VEGIPGVRKAEANRYTGSLLILYDPGVYTREALLQELKEKIDSLPEAQGSQSLAPKEPLTKELMGLALGSLLFTGIALKRLWAAPSRWARSPHITSLSASSPTFWPAIPWPGGRWKDGPGA